MSSESNVAGEKKQNVSSLRNILDGFKVKFKVNGKMIEI